MPPQTERVKPVRHNDARNIRRGATLSARFGQDGHPFRAPKRACAGGPAIPAYTTTTGSLKHMWIWKRNIAFLSQISMPKETYLPDLL